MVATSMEGLEEALSLERFGRYLTWAGGDKARALELYTLNTRISESLYVPLQSLELVRRNRIHSVMSAVHHENWFHNENLPHTKPSGGPPCTPSQQGQADKA